jgi:hypothetical protein
MLNFVRVHNTILQEKETRQDHAIVYSAKSSSRLTKVHPCFNVKKDKRL